LTKAKRSRHFFPQFCGRTPIFVGDDEVLPLSPRAVALLFHSAGRVRARLAPSRAPARRGKGLPISPNPETAHDPERQIRTQNLDVALIGHSCAAAFVDANTRIVWWCFPRFDCDPVFSPLLAGDEDKGFTDVVPARHAQSDYVRNTAIVETVPPTRRRAADHGFRAALRVIRVGVPATANHPDRTARRPAAHHGLRTPLRALSSGHRRPLGQSAASLVAGRHHKIATRLPSSWEDA
jgi:Domain of unknown function (DUF5911)